jgi:putative peptidoglycan lipid II flippase
LATVLGYVLAIPLPRWLGIAGLWGAAGLTASASVAGWVELMLLRRALNARIGWTGLPADYVAKLWTGAVAAAATAWGIRVLHPPLHPMMVAGIVLIPYGAVFLAAALAFRLPEATTIFKRPT